MKTKLTLVFLLTISSFQLFVSCKKDEETAKINKSEAITLGASYANDIYYSLKNGVVAEVPRTNWDIAFSVSSRSSSILINEGAGVELKAYPTTTGWTWASTSTDITNYASWAVLRNSDTDWETGAFNANATTHPNYGWGVYDMGSHNIDGVTLYIIKIPVTGGSPIFKKIWIEKKYSAQQKYTFRYANVDGTNEQVVSNLDVSTSKANYVYYSLQTNQVLADREPDATKWDLLFTKWVNNTISYPVTGVLQNISTKAIDLTSADFNNITYTDEQFVADINTIGSDWKTPNQLNQLELVPNRVFVVKDKDNNVFKIRFTSFAGETSGNLTFDIVEF